MLIGNSISSEMSDFRLNVISPSRSFVGALAKPIVSFALDLSATPTVRLNVKDFQWPVSSVLKLKDILDRAVLDSR